MATCDYVNGDTFEGIFEQGKKNGKGVYSFADGTRLEGVWKDDQYQERG